MSVTSTPSITMKERCIQLWSIYLVWRMGMRTYFRYWAVNFLAPVTEPVFYLIAFGYGVGALVEVVTISGNQVSYGEFLAPGMAAVGVLFQSYIEGSYGQFHRIFIRGQWKGYLTTPLLFADVYWGELLWCATKGLFAGVATMIVGVCFGYVRLSDFIVGIPVMFLGGIAFSALGMSSAAISKHISQVGIPMHLTIVPMFAFSGTYFPRDTLPGGIRWVVDLLPMSGFVDLMRSRFEAGSVLFQGALVLIGWTALLVLFSYRRLYRRVYQ